MPALSRGFSGYSYGLQRPWPEAAFRHHPRQEPRALTRMRESVRGTGASLLPTAMHFLTALRQNGLIPFVVLPAFGLAQNPGLVLVDLRSARS